MTRLARRIGLACCLCIAPALTTAQVGGPPGSGVDTQTLFRMLSGTPRSKTTRVDLQNSLAEIEAGLAAGSYDEITRATRQAEAAMIRKRLNEGDIFAGDVVMLQVSGDSRMDNSYAVTPERTIQVPGAGEISVAGLLRSELEERLTEVMGRFVRNPTVRAEPLMRVQISGAVSRPGFYTVPTSMPIPDLLMQFANGPTQRSDMGRSKIRRGGEQILSGSAVEEAIRLARSIDAMNLQAGDEIFVGERPNSGRVTQILAGVGTVVSLIFLFSRF
ncbi:MAG: polysaccharide biosynthesis/export family protein [Gemmatimonadales bacterium]|nr:polysaccharide biosynthesis/export family protein [Gemmatimonadales bacterium]MDZ4389002.1 polysaccharide biosynthesis/export family protein [Gemmatimonadales bacterium]